jgi:hypothetical protein
VLRVIKAAQRLGFTLEEVAELVEAGTHRHRCTDRGFEAVRRSSSQRSSRRPPTCGDGIVLFTYWVTAQFDHPPRPFCLAALDTGFSLLSAPARSHK